MIHKQFKPLILPMLVATTLMASSGSTLAGERESLEEIRSTTLSLIDLLVQEGVLSKEKADVILKQAEAAKLKAQQTQAAGASEPKAGESAEGATKAIRVQYVPEHVKNEMRAEIEKDVMEKLHYKAGERLALPAWIDRVEWTGDIRIRYQNDQFPDGNPAPGEAFTINEVRNVPINNTTEDRERHRVRARLGANVKINDWMTGGVRFTTGLLNTPVTPNQTEGFSQGKYIFGLDRAFLKADPKSWLTLQGGRFENPFFSTDLVWDPDLAFDGLAASFHPKLNEHFSVFSTVGAFPIEEIESSDINKTDDKWMYAIQAGIQWQSSNKSTIKFAAALYDFDNVEGKANPVGDSLKFAGTAPGFRQKGNNTFSIDQANGNFCGSGGLCGLASQFRELNLTGQIDIAKFDPVHVMLQGDYVRNIGFDKNEVLKRTGNLYEEENEAYQVLLSVGMPIINKRHDWQIFGAYKRIEADAVLDAFNDSNFHLGGTDTKGWTIGANYGLDTNTWLTARWVSSDEISGPPLSIDTLLLDLNAKF